MLAAHDHETTEFRRVLGETAAFGINYMYPFYSAVVKECKVEAGTTPFI